MSKIRLFVVLVVLATAAAGCARAVEDALEGAVERQLEEESGSGNVNVDLNEDDGSVSIETDEGSIEIGGAEIPNDFPLPLPEDYEVVSVVTQTGEAAGTLVTLGFDPVDFDVVAAMYEDFFNDQGWEVSLTNSSAGADKLAIIGAEGFGLSASIIVGHTEGDDVATVIAQYGTN